MTMNEIFYFHFHLHAKLEFEGEHSLTARYLPSFHKIMQSSLLSLMGMLMVDDLLVKDTIISNTILRLDCSLGNGSLRS